MLYSWLRLYCNSLMCDSSTFFRMTCIKYENPSQYLMILELAVKVQKTRNFRKYGKLANFYKIERILQ